MAASTPVQNWKSHKLWKKSTSLARSSVGWEAGRRLRWREGLSIPCHAVPYQWYYHTISYHTMSYHTVPCHTISYHTMSYHGRGWKEGQMEGGSLLLAASPFVHPPSPWPKILKDIQIWSIDYRASFSWIVSYKHAPAPSAMQRLHGFKLLPSTVWSRNGNFFSEQSKDQPDHLVYGQV